MSNDPDARKGALTQDRAEQKSNTSLRGQNQHRGKGDLLQGHDSDFPEPGENEEHSMEGVFQHSRFGGDPEHTTDNESGEGELEDQDPGDRQKRNQNDQEEDPLAA